MTIISKSVPLKPETLRKRTHREPDFLPSAVPHGVKQNTKRFADSGLRYGPYRSCDAVLAEADQPGRTSHGTCAPAATRRAAGSRARCRWAAAPRTYCRCAPPCHSSAPPGTAQPISARGGAGSRRPEAETGFARSSP